MPDLPQACGCTSSKPAVKKLTFTWKDRFKVLWSWLRAFKTTYSITPGLYYTGKSYDITTPLLVTCNYHMTVFKLWRTLKDRNVRILIIDTKGINVWCSSGKGQFGAREILKQVVRYGYDILTDSDKVEMILPKLSFSGVSIAELKKYSVIPKIGPVYISELPAYLDDKPVKNRNKDRYKFKLKDRLFILVPSLVQFTKYALYATGILFVWNHYFTTGIYWQAWVIAMLNGLLYIILFPLLPSRSFTFKGLFLFLLQGGALSWYHFSGRGLEFRQWLFYMFLTAGFNIFFSLYFTGNSGVSNYSLVKKEIVRFLPVSAFMFLGALVTIIIEGVSK